MVRIGMALIVLMVGAPPASSQETPGAVAKSWGLLGSWALSCERARQIGRFDGAFEIDSNGKLLFDNGRRSIAVTSAFLRPDGQISMVLQDGPSGDGHVMVLQREGQKIRLTEYGNGKNEYATRNGVSATDGKEKQFLVRCDG
jgi:hypothetical protein